MKWVRQLYDWVLSWADHPQGQTALFVIAFAEASFFPIPPDVLLIAMAVGSSKNALRFAGICTLGSVLGGVTGYFIGSFLWEILGQYFFAYVPGFTPEIFAKVSQIYEDNAFWAVFTAGFTPIPYKVFTVSAGATGISFLPFIAASICSRSLRFFAVGILMKIFGPPVRGFIDKYFNILAIVFTLLLIGGFLVIKGVVH